MKPYAFSYRRVRDVSEACALLAEHRDAAAVLAGGQSLMPLLSMRLTSPTLVIDINRLDDLQNIVVGDSHLEIGALCRHSTVLHASEVKKHAPILVDALRLVAHPAIRNRGTFGGSVALADPAAELPACCVALEAEIVLASADGIRTVHADDFFLGTFTTAREPNELVTAIRIPRDRGGDGYVFDEIARRQGDYAIVGLAAMAGQAEALVPRFVFFGIGDRPRLARSVGTLLAGTSSGRVAQPELELALDADFDDLDLTEVETSFKRRLAGVLAQRAIRQFSESVEPRS